MVSTVSSKCNGTAKSEPKSDFMCHLLVYMNITEKFSLSQKNENSWSTHFKLKQVDCTWFIIQWAFFVLFCLLTDYMLLYVTKSRFYCRLLWRRCSFISWCLYLFIEAYYSVNTAKLIDPLGFVKNKRSPHNLFAIRSD